jgi:hypothetical protein
METVNERVLNESELKEFFYKWVSIHHPAKTNPKVIDIKKDKIYFTYDGSIEESVIHTKLIQDLFDRGKI